MYRISHKAIDQFAKLIYTQTGITQLKMQTQKKPILVSGRTDLYVSCLTRLVFVSFLNYNICGNDIVFEEEI